MYGSDVLDIVLGPMYAGALVLERRLGGGTGRSFGGGLAGNWSISRGASHSGRIVDRSVESCKALNHFFPAAASSSLSPSFSADAVVFF